MDEDLILRVEAHKISRVLKNHSIHTITELLKENYHLNDRINVTVDTLLQREIITDVEEDAQNIVNLFPDLEFKNVVHELSEIEPSALRAQQYIRKYLHRKRNLNQNTDQNDEPDVKRGKFHDYTVASTSTNNINTVTEQDFDLPSSTQNSDNGYGFMAINPITISDVKEENISSFIHNIDENASTVNKEDIATENKNVIVSYNSVIPDEDMEDSEEVTLVMEASTKQVASASSNNHIERNEENDEEKILVMNKLQDDLFRHVLAMFPSAEPTFVRERCQGRTIKDIDDIIDHMLTHEYPERAPKEPSPPPQPQNAEDKLEMLKCLLPDADPTFLQQQVEQLDEDGISQFVDRSLQTKDYPTMKEYLRKQQISAQQKQYTSDFSVENFLKIIPDPIKCFKDSKRAAALNTDSNHKDIFYAKMIIKNLFSRHRIRDIDHLFKANKYDVVKTAKAIQESNDFISSKRKPYDVDSSTIQNIPLLQELAWITHREDIVKYLDSVKKQREKNFLAAKAANKLVSCCCCYDEEVMLEESVTCQAGCIFCKSCVQKCAEIAIGENKLEFPCLQDCGNHISMQTLQMVLEPNVFSRMVQKKQLQEVRAAGLEDLEMCPFCDFATIPVPTDKVFRCLNSECMKESCRTCHEPNHVPLRCDEVEKEDEVKQRTYIENKMTEALVRKCWKCGIKFIKHDGCNKMTCSCGAMMCYVCLKPVKDYTHFNGQGGDKFHLCPLYSDTNVLHDQNLLRGAEAAKAELGKDLKNLKFDPTVDLDVEKIQKAREAEKERLKRMAVQTERMRQVNAHHVRVRQANVRVHIHDNRQRQHGVPANNRQRIRAEIHHHRHGNPRHVDGPLGPVPLPANVHVEEQNRLGELLLAAFRENNGFEPYD